MRKHPDFSTSLNLSICLAEIVDRLLIAFLCGFDNAVLQMILKNDLAGIVDRGAHRGDLNQHLGVSRALPLPCA